VIYDKEKNILFGARDRFGVKPYLTISINKKSVIDYLIFGYEEQEEEDFLKGIYELFPSYAFILDLKSFDSKKWKYYNLNWTDSYESFDGQKLKKYSEDVKELIFNSVALRLRADVSVGTCLSGGLDSSTIACTINELLKAERLEVIGEHPKVFTTSYNDKSVDESHWAKVVVDKIKAQ